MALPTPVNDQITGAATPQRAATRSPEIQQQLSVIYQAATTCLVTLIYSELTLMGSIDGKTAMNIDVAAGSDATALKALLEKTMPSAQTPTLHSQAEATITPFNDIINDDAQEWSRGVKEILSTLRTEAWELHELVLAAGKDQIKQAALNQVVQQMLTTPEQFEPLERIAAFIKAW
jgi:hypothetical protein